MVKEDCDLNIEIISGEREAELSFMAVERDFGSDVLVIDIGGGSTEFIFKKDSNLNLSSLELGSVTIQEKFGKSDPISEKDFSAMKTFIKAKLDITIQNPSNKLVATAGTATTLAAMKLKLEKYNHSEVHGLALNKTDIEKIIEELRTRTIEERKKLPGLEPKRADVILPGSLILNSVIEKFGFKEVTVSDRGVRWGLIYEKCVWIR